MLLPTFPQGTEERIFNLLKQVKTASEVKRVQSILLGAQGKKSEEIAKIIDFSPGYIKQLWSKYKSEGEKILIGENRGQTRSRAHLNLKEEKEFLAQFIEKAKTGGFLEVSQIKQVYEEKYQITVKPSVIYDLLHRHGWRKIAPRSKHPKSDKLKQKKFKKKTFLSLSVKSPKKQKN